MQRDTFHEPMTDQVAQLLVSLADQAAKTGRRSEAVALLHQAYNLFDARFSEPAFEEETVLTRS